MCGRNTGGRSQRSQTQQCVDIHCCGAPCRASLILGYKVKLDNGCMDPVFTANPTIQSFNLNDAQGSMTAGQPLAIPGIEAL